MIPNVTITWCYRRSICKYCEQPIEAGKPVVKVFYWNKGDENSRKWNRSTSYHFPDCYIKQGQDYLDRNPYVARSGSNRRLALSDENRRTRFLLVRKFNELYHRRRNIKVPYPDRLTVEIELTKRMTDTMLDMVPVGGVPKSWAAKIV